MLPPLSLRRGPFRVRQGRCSSSARCQQDSGHHLRRRRRARFVTLPMRETTLALRHTNALFTIAFDGNTKMAVVKDVQKNPVKRIIEHVDFLEVKAGEKIDVEVPVFVEGTPKRCCGIRRHSGAQGSR